MYPSTSLHVNYALVATLIFLSMLTNEFLYSFIISTLFLVNASFSHQNRQRNLNESTRLHWISTVFLLTDSFSLWNQAPFLNWWPFVQRKKEQMLLITGIVANYYNQFRRYASRILALKCMIAPLGGLLEWMNKWSMWNRIKKMK